MPNKPVPAGGEAVSAPPDVSDILAEYSKLLTLIDIAFEMVDHLSVNDPSPAQRGMLCNAQNMMHVIWDVAHRFDKDLDACASQCGEGAR
ncbi:hypothetical protein [Neorhizobium sp. DAR64860/K0K1]|uniref:hypothetical protein n=1 Tax=Neorhizobium sp. DAR64860/K0K1 TaxID=3421955 RepID=UPI003D275663